MITAKPTPARLCSASAWVLVWLLLLCAAWPVAWGRPTATETRGRPAVAEAAPAVAEPAPAQNRLANEKSPYLRQHSGNPIDWYPWGAAAFQAARRENKLIFLSIGYSSCHWCHVMSGESFSNATVGRIMNANFIAILVDREERPDVDAAYSRVMQTMIGTYGWPMNIFLTPAGKPFMGATFIPRKRLLRLLRQFREIWENDPGRIEEIGVQVTAKLRRESTVGFSEEKLPDEAMLGRVFTLLRRKFDKEHGGFGSGAKFLPPLKLSLLLRIHKRTAEAEALRMVTFTLDRMARGGVYDQVGGGFHRYSTDRRWHVPHFEKMLPENAVLARTYLEAFQVTRKRDYEIVARGTLDYILRDLGHPQGGFYAAEDSDSEKTEGKFYVWTMGELRRLLSGPELERVVTVYGVSSEGNFNPWLKDVEENAGLRVVKNGNILTLNPAGRIPDKGDPLLQSARRKLLLARSRRVRPYRDEKILTGWNGLAIEALAKGYQVLGEDRYLSAAQRAARFLLDNLREADGTLFRGWRDGTSYGPGFLTDYAYLVRGLLVLYQSDFDRRWIEAALELQEIQQRLFWDSEGGGYFMSGQPTLPSLPRMKPFVDETIPSGNAVAALNLLQTADLTLRWKWKKRVARIISAAAAAGLRNDPTRYPQLLMVLDYLLDKAKEVAVVGPPRAVETRRVLRLLHTEFLPNMVLASGAPTLEDSQERSTLPLLFSKPMLRGKTTTYVCENNICRLPTNDLATVRKLVLEHSPYALPANRE